jgi:hypothetical protein
MQRLELFFGSWRIALANIILYFGIDIVVVEQWLKIFILIASAVISVLTILIKWKEYKRVSNNKKGIKNG